MESFGDERAGFSVDYDPATKTVHVHGWGFWGAEVASAFGDAVEQACRTSPHGARLRMDLADLKPMRDEGRRSFGDLVGALPRLGIDDATIAIGSQITKLQLLRIVTTSTARTSSASRRPARGGGLLREGRLQTTPRKGGRDGNR